MAVDFDAKGTPVSNTNVSSITDSSIVVGTGINRVLLYSLNFGWSTHGQPINISVTWDAIGANQSFSLITQEFNVGNNCLTQLWGLINPVSGNKVVSSSWLNVVDIVKGAGISFYGVDQGGGTTTFNFTSANSGNSNSPSVTITTTADDAVVGSSAATGSFSYISMNNAEIFHDSGGLIDSGANYEVNGSTAIMSAAVGGSVDWAFVGANIKAHIIPHTSTVTPSSELVGIIFTGKNGSGLVSAAGLKVGDKLLFLESSMYQGGNIQMNTAGYFEIIISNDDNILQINNMDLSNWTFNAIFVRGL